LVSYMCGWHVRAPAHQPRHVATARAEGSSCKRPCRRLPISLMWGCACFILETVSQHTRLVQDLSLRCVRAVSGKFSREVCGLEGKVRAWGECRERQGMTWIQNVCGQTRWRLPCTHNAGRREAEYPGSVVDRHRSVSIPPALAATDQLLGNHVMEKVIFVGILT
jgi:hypothetical protein